MSKKFIPCDKVEITTSENELFVIKAGDKHPYMIMYPCGEHFNFTVAQLLGLAKFIKSSISKIKRTNKDDKEGGKIQEVRIFKYCFPEVANSFKVDIKIQDSEGFDKALVDIHGRNKSFVPADLLEIAEAAIELVKRNSREEK